MKRRKKFSNKPNRNLPKKRTTRNNKNHNPRNSFHNFFARKRKSFFNLLDLRNRVSASAIIILLTIATLFLGSLHFIHANKPNLSVSFSSLDSEDRFRQKIIIKNNSPTDALRLSVYLEDIRIRGAKATIKVEGASTVGHSSIIEGGKIKAFDESSILLHSILQRNIPVHAVRPNCTQFDLVISYQYKLLFFNRQEEFRQTYVNPRSDTNEWFVKGPHYDNCIE